MRAGRLRTRITLQQPVTTQNAAGEKQVTSWTTFATVWAEVDHNAGRTLGREHFAADQLQADVTHPIRIRYLAGVSPVMRALLGGRTLEIKAVVNTDERNRELWLMCVEGPIT